MKRVEPKYAGHREKNVHEWRFSTSTVSFCGPPVQVNANVSWCKAKSPRNRPPKIGAVAAAAAEIHPIGGEIGCCLAGRREFHSDVARSRTHSSVVQAKVHARKSGAATPSTDLLLKHQ